MVLNFDQELIPEGVGAQYTLENVERVILNACRNKGWLANPIDQGAIEASITIRTRHRAKIAIDFTTTHYSIHYVDSSGLDYRNGRIHNNYSHWGAKLDAEIKREFDLKIQHS